MTDTGKCSVCNNILSYFPIYQTKNNQNICGRCPLLVEGDYTRNIKYEKEMEDKLFACRYEDRGCEEKHRPQEIPHHEEICLFRLITCPTSHFSTCPWKGSPRDLIHHCEIDHVDFFLEDNKFDLHLNKILGSYYFIKYDEEMFLVETKLACEEEKKILRISAAFCGLKSKIEKYICSATLRCGCRKLTTKFYPSSVKNLPEIETTEIDLQSVANGDRISVHLEIVDKKLLSTATINVNTVLAELECEVCCNFMTPPIFLCFSGHSVCRICKANVNGLCPYCRNIITNVRNQALERISSLPIHCCKYPDCTFTASYATVKLHESFCIFSNDSLEYCPFFLYFGCQRVEFRRNLVHHMARDHPTSFFDSNVVEIKSNTLVSGRQSLFVVKYLDRLFMLKLQFNRLRACVSMQLNAPPQEVGRFKYEISMFHGRTLLMKSSGLNLGESNRITIMLDFLQYQVVCQDDVTFKIHIRK